METTHFTHESTVDESIHTHQVPSQLVKMKCLFPISDNLVSR